MNKFEFSTELRAKLWSVPPEDARRSVDYYSEMIDDRMEEGLTEEEAVAAIGDLDEIVKNILAEMPRTPVVTEAPKKRRGLRVWEIILLILGAPLWIPLVGTVLAVVLTAYLLLWVAVAVLFCGALSTGVAALGCLFGVIAGRGPEAAVMLGMALACAGITILLAMGSNLAVKGMTWLSKQILRGVKAIFARKERSA